jgi:GPH family glycoside/pentoside/hexuronide:cation symporter
MFAGVFVLAPIVKRRGKRDASLLGIFSTIFGCLILVFAGTSLHVVLIATVFRAFGSACIIGTLFAMINDTVEYGEWKTGLRTAALVSTASAFGANIGNGLGMAIVSFALAIGGYVAIGDGIAHSGPTGQSESALAAITFVYIWVPLILLAGMAVIMFFYKLEKEYPTILAELNARKAKAEGETEQ